VDSKANRLLIDFIGKMFGVPASRVNIARGQVGRMKTVHMHGPIPHMAAVLERLAGAGTAPRGSA
jgi:uncharacterized protein YggU (UPF0235/DUF167 family)